MTQSGNSSTGLGSQSISKDHCFHCCSEPASLWQECSHGSRFACCFACSQQVDRCPQCGQPLSKLGVARTSSSEAEQHADEQNAEQQLQHSQTKYVIVMAVPVFLVYYHRHWISKEDLASRTADTQAEHMDGKNVLVFWRHGTVALLEWILTNPHLELGIVSGSMDVPFLSRIICAVLRDGLGWTDVSCLNPP